MHVNYVWGAGHWVKYIIIIALCAVAEQVVGDVVDPSCRPTSSQTSAQEPSLGTPAFTP